MGKVIGRALCLLACSIALAGAAVVCAPGSPDGDAKRPGQPEGGAETGLLQADEGGGESEESGQPDDEDGAPGEREAGGRKPGQPDTDGGKSEESGQLGAGKSGQPGAGKSEGTEGTEGTDNGGRKPEEPGQPGAGKSEGTGTDNGGRKPEESGQPGGSGSCEAAAGSDSTGSRRGEASGGSDDSSTAEDTTIIVTGDVLFGNVFRANYDKNGIAGVISEELLEELRGADILLINNEFPFSTRGLPMEEKQFTFRCDPVYAGALGEMGVDVVSLANNHTLDYGREALSDTFAVLDGEGILYAGAGESAERAEEIQVIEVNGKRIGILAATRVIPVAGWNVEFQTPGLFACYDDTRLNELVAEADCDFLIVYPHWGVEYEAYPEDYQTGIARRCLASGADVVVGCHTHCLQGAEWIDGKPVFYSLGNFVFGKDIDRSAALKITLSADGGVRYQFLPVTAKGGVTGLAEEEKALQILRYLDGISPRAQVAEDGFVTE